MYTYSVKGTNVTNAGGGAEVLFSFSVPNRPRVVLTYMWLYATARSVSTSDTLATCPADLQFGPRFNTGAPVTSPLPDLNCITPVGGIVESENGKWLYASHLLPFVGEVELPPSTTWYIDCWARLPIVPGGYVVQFTVMLGFL